MDREIDLFIRNYLKPLVCGFRPPIMGPPDRGGPRQEPAPMAQTSCNQARRTVVNE